MNSAKPNGVEAAISQWHEREKSLRSLFTPNPTNERFFLLTKLEHFENLQQSFKGTISGDEKLTLRLLKGESLHLRKILYPRAGVRLMRNFGNRVVRLIRNLTGIERREQALKMQTQYLDKKYPGKMDAGVNKEKQKNVDEPVNTIRHNKKLRPGMAAQKSDLLPKLRSTRKKGLGM